jgi:hypothetical protein
MSARDSAVAEHEAAHMVVGLALGLKFKRARLEETVIKDGLVELGHVWFAGSARRGLALTVMYCAGIAWELKRGADPVAIEADRKLAHRYLISKHDMTTAVRLADELLTARRKAHARVASELCDRDLGPADVARLIID